MYKVGDKVKWESKSRGTARAKIGEVVAVIPAGSDFVKFEKKIMAETGCLSAYGGGFHRRHESYAVLVHRKNEKPVLYWPIVNALSVA